LRLLKYKHVTMSLIILAQKRSHFLTLENASFAEWGAML